MYKISMALGWSVIKMQLQSGYQSEHGDLWGKIKQHRFIISDSIDAYYSSKAEEEDLLEEYRYYMSSVMNIDQYVEILDTFEDKDRNLNNYLKNKNRNVAIVICENEELKVSKSSCRYQYTIEQAAEDEKCPLSLYSVVASFYGDEGETALPYINWVKNIISEEKEINIIDKNALENSRNYNCLVEHYFPIIPRGCKVNLHVPYNSQYIDKVIESSKEANIDLHIIKYNQMKHDRYITTSNRVIVLGVGIDFMQVKQGKTLMRTGCNFALRKKNKGLSYMSEEYKLAGDPVQGQ